VEALVAADIPHNLLIAIDHPTASGRADKRAAAACGNGGEARVFLFPREKQRPMAGGAIQVALAEVCGLGIYYEADAYAAASDAAQAGLLAAANLDTPTWEAFKRRTVSAFSGLPACASESVPLVDGASAAGQ
jgi:hypothetical protein